MQPSIEVTNLVKKFGSRTAVNGISFTVSVREHEVFGLLGPNGAGKSTTIAMLSNLLTFDEGSIRIAGYDIGKDSARIKPLIGLAPQEVALYPSLSAWDNLVFFGHIYKLKGGFLKKRVQEALALVGLSDRARDILSTFSGGMKRRINIAAALIHSPKILFLDEPTVGIDPQSRNFIFEQVEQLKKYMTIIYITHYMEEAQRLCDRVAIIDEGKIVANDTPKGLMSLLGGGVILTELGAKFSDALFPLIQNITSVSEAMRDSSGLITIKTNDTRHALLELVKLCETHQAEIVSLEVLEQNLESVFLHLTGKRLRD
jgi:ABC-2 type transport system ATP-binding protein